MHAISFKPPCLVVQVQSCSAHNKVCCKCGCKPFSSCQCIRWAIISRKCGSTQELFASCTAPQQAHRHQLVPAYLRATTAASCVKLEKLRNLNLSSKWAQDTKVVHTCTDACTSQMLQRDREGTACSFRSTTSSSPASYSVQNGNVPRRAGKRAGKPAADDNNSNAPLALLTWQASALSTQLSSIVLHQGQQNAVKS